MIRHEVIDRAIDMIVAQVDPDQVFVIGSYASGTAKPSSVSDRRPGAVVIGGYPDGCRLVDVGQNGSINCDGWKVYLSHALAGYAVGLQGFERGYRVRFFHVLLGTFVPGTHETLQPTVADET